MYNCEPICMVIFDHSAIIYQTGKESLDDVTNKPETILASLKRKFEKKN